jgi:hypothetical protein
MSELDDLDTVDTEVRETRKTFVAACTLYRDEGRADAQVVVERFLMKVIGEESPRPRSIHELTEEAIALIKGFEETRTNLMTRVALVGVRFHQLVISLQTALMEAILRPSTSSSSPQGLRDLEVIKLINDDLNARREEMEHVFKVGVAKTVEAGEVVVKVQKLATLIVLMRQYTLRVFKIERVDDSLFQKLERVNDMLLEELKSWTHDKAMETGWALIQDVGLVVCGVSLPGATPFLVVLKLMSKAAAEVKPRKVSQEMAPSDIAVDLRDRLVDQNAFFDGVLRECKEAYDRVDAIAATI